MRRRRKRRVRFGICHARCRSVLIQDGPTNKHKYDTAPAFGPQNHAILTGCVLVGPACSFATCQHGILRRPVSTSFYLPTFQSSHGNQTECIKTGGLDSRFSPPQIPPRAFCSVEIHSPLDTRPLHTVCKTNLRQTEKRQTPRSRQ